MKKNNEKLGLICSVVFSVIFSSINSSADEIGVATGLNTSIFKTSYKNSTGSTVRAEHHKTDLLNPIEITFQKDFTKFLGVHLALQYSKRSFSDEIQKIELDEKHNPIPAGITRLEYMRNFLSLEISPIFFHQFNNILINARAGVSGDFYINECESINGDKSIFRDKSVSTSILSFVSGIGLGYIIKDRFEIGLRSSISRTLTDIYMYMDGTYDSFYLNFHNVIYFSFLL
jgi:hypothetical protein